VTNGREILYDATVFRACGPSVARDPLSQQQHQASRRSQAQAMRVGSLECWWGAITEK
jgi:hypothetical protein